MSSPFRDKYGQTLGWGTALQKILTRVRSYWEELTTGYLWWSVGYIPSHAWRKLNYRLAGVRLGKGSTIHMMARLYHPQGVEIGEDSLIGEQVVLDGRGGLRIGNHVDVATSVKFFTSQHNLSDPGFAAVDSPVSIEDYVFIGPNAVILPGVTIGKGAVVGAGAVVTKSVSAGVIVGGVPAKELRKRELTEFRYRLGRPRLFQ